MPGDAAGWGGEDRNVSYSDLHGNGGKVTFGLT